MISDGSNKDCRMTPTERRALHPAAIVEAWEWIDTYRPHYATQGRDWQTTDNMSAASRGWLSGIWRHCARRD